MPEFDLTQPVADFSVLSLEDIGALRTQAVAAAGPIREKHTAELTTEDLTTLRVLRKIVDGADAEKTKREAAAAEAAELLDGLAPDEDDDDEDAEATPEGDEADEDDDAESDADDADKKEPAAVTAGAGGRTTPRVKQVAPTAPKTKQTTTLPENFARLVSGADADARQFSGWHDVAKSAERRLASYQGLSTGSRHNIAVIKREFSADLVMNGDAEHDARVIAHATDEKRLPGNSLVAAAGWCAPSQTVYDLCELETTDGLVDVPETQITRGGLRFTQGPDFSTIFGGSGYFHQTESQVIANTTKPCMEIPCPDFTDIRLEVDGVCITGSLLQRRGYPELVERFIRGALVAHTHKLNQFAIAQMVAGSTAVDANPIGDPVLDTDSVTGLLSVVELAAEDIRYRHRLSMNATVEVVLPHWALAHMRASFSRRTGQTETNVSNAQIQAHFANRGARVQYVYDWQDAYSGLAAGPGGDTALIELPAEVQFLVYPAGTWLRGSEDVIRLDTIYDSTNLSTNRYTALFTEEGILMAKVCHDSRVYTAPLCPTGITAAPVAFVCG